MKKMKKIRKMEKSKNQKSPKTFGDLINICSTQVPTYKTYFQKLNPDFLVRYALNVIESIVQVSSLVIYLSAMRDAIAKSDLSLMS